MKDAIARDCTCDGQEHKLIQGAGPERGMILHLHATACNERGSHIHDKWVTSRGQGFQLIRLKSFRNGLLTIFFFWLLNSPGFDHAWTFMAVASTWYIQCLAIKMYITDTPVDISDLPPVASRGERVTTRETDTLVKRTARARFEPARERHQP